MVAGLLQGCPCPSAAPMELTSIRPPLNPRAVVASSIAFQKPSRLAKRKNHLRPKILKTLPPNPSPPPLTIVVPLTTHENEEALINYDVDVESSLVELPAAGETSESDGFQSASAVVEENLGIGKFSTKSVLKYGAYFVGIFLFQTICAVWFLSSARSGSSTGKLKDSESGDDEKERLKRLINGSAKSCYFDESEMEKKVEEIRLMAREARRIERKKSKGEAEVGEMEEEESASKSRDAIEKEIASRLNKLEKRLKSGQKSAASQKGVFSGSKEVGDGLVFKKKHKFRGDSKGENSQTPKGFGSENHRPAAGKGNGNPQVLQSDGIEFGNGTGRSVGQKELEVDDAKSKAGNRSLGHLQRSSRDSSSTEVEVSSREMSPPQNYRSLGSKKGTTTKSTSSSISRRKDDTDHFWWLNLPCVFAILMRRSSDSEGAEGLFSLKITSDEDDDSLSSYVLGFEDRVDANNFCYLLESFFQDLGDFNADIVPLLREELRESVKEKTMKVFVLRKGQLRLYAGQPFSDVESELMSLMKDYRSTHE